MSCRPRPIRAAGRRKRRKNVIRCILRAIISGPAAASPSVPDTNIVSPTRAPLLSSGPTLFDFTRDVHGRDDDLLAARRVATDQVDSIPRCCLEHAGRERSTQSSSLSQSVNASVIQRGTAHCGDVGQIDGNDAVADVGGVEIGREMHALDERIDDLNLLFTGSRLEDGAVVADPDRTPAFEPRRVKYRRISEFIHRCWHAPRSHASTAPRRRGTH